MRARQRHSNPKDAGAFLSLDSRFISGLANGAAVSTWTSRTGTNNATQATTARQPIYTTNVFGGQPSVKFTKANTHFMRTGNGPFGTTSNIWILAVASKNATADFGAVINQGDFTTFGATVAELIFGNGTRRWSTLVSGGSSPGSTVLDASAQTQNVASIAVASCAASSGVNLNVNGVSVGTGSSLPGNINNASTPVGIGGRGSGTVGSADALDGDIAQIIYAAVSMSGGLAKRLRHSAAFSFKIACS